MKTIGVDLWDGQARRVGANVATVMRSVPASSLRLANARALFIGAYSRFAEPCRAVDEPGLAVIAVDERTGRAAGIVTLLARVQRPVAAIIGRHDRCDLYLAGHDELALRQLAVVVSPVTSYERGTPVGYRVLDLRTAHGMTDESGRALHGVRAEGPSILRCGGYILYMLPLGDPTDWPAHGDDAWQMLPERVYFDELAHCAGGSIPHIPLANPSARLGASQSVVFRTHGPRTTGMVLVGAPGDEVAGTLEIAGSHKRMILDVGAMALKDGVLVGRYERCDGAAAISDASLSRVHALLLQIDDRLVVVDTASFNGTRTSDSGGDGERQRLIELDRPLELKLGTGTRIRWRWSAS